jgi:L-arabinokinase
MRPSRARLALYVTGHGFGHAVRSAELLRLIWAQDESVEAVIRTTAPGWLFGSITGREVPVEGLPLDIAVAQSDPLHVDLEETLRKAKRYLSRWDELVAREVEACRKAQVSLIVGDIPPVAFAAARALGIPSLALANFSWEWIYEDYASKEPGFGPVASLLKEAYSQASLLLKLPMSPSMDTFPNQKAIPLLVRTTPEPRDKLRLRLGLGGQEKAVLLSFGGIGMEALDLDALGRFKGVRFLLFEAPSGRALPANVTLLPRRCPNHHEWVKASDAVVSKPGYGIVSECLASGTPILYTSRGDFAEYPLLVEAITRHLPSRFVPREDFLKGRWMEALEELLEAQRPEGPLLDCSGGEVAARLVLEYLRGEVC